MGRKITAAAEAALDRAQDMIYDASDATTTKRRIALAEKALAVSPLCADAYVILAEQADPGSDEELDLRRRGVDAGETALGKAGFEEFAGHFWGFLETRPYMRARPGLAQALWRRGRRDEAIDHLRAMLGLNPNDNQGVRYILAAWLVEAQRDDDLARLLAEYADDGAATWTWTSALAAFRRRRDRRERQTPRPGAGEQHPCRARSARRPQTAKAAVALHQLWRRRRSRLLRRRVRRRLGADAGRARLAARTDAGTDAAETAAEAREVAVGGTTDRLS